MRALVLTALVLTVWLAAPGIGRAQPCAPDDALTEAAQELLLSGERPSASAVARAARRAGSQLPVVSALVSADPARRDAFLRRLAERGRAPLRCGEARGEGTRLLLAGPAAGELWWGDAGEIVVELAPGWTAPILYARAEDGATWREEVRGARVRIPADLGERATLQLVATGPDGPRPVAEVRPPEPVEAEVMPRSDLPPRVRLAALRRRSPLRDNRLLRRVADAHAARVCREGRVAHGLGEGDPRERLAREGIRARHVGETASRAPSEAQAFDAMLESASHRAALVDRRFTDVGVGRARDAEGRACLVVLLAAWPRAVPYR